MYIFIKVILHLVYFWIFEKLNLVQKRIWNIRFTISYWMEERCYLLYWLYGKGGFDIYPIIYDPMPVRVRMKITTEELLGNIQTSRIRRGKNCKKVVKYDHFFLFLREDCGPGDISSLALFAFLLLLSVQYAQNRNVTKKNPF